MASIHEIDETYRLAAMECIESISAANDAPSMGYTDETDWQTLIPSNYAHKHNLDLERLEREIYEIEHADELSEMMEEMINWELENERHKGHKREDRIMTYYYYTKWTLPYDVLTEANKETTYHTTWISQSPPKEFLESVSETWLEIRRFRNLEEMNAFAKTVGLLEVPSSVLV